mmetsp:Transcript_53622/g.160067  ORF Transcript_53622/g.160067 Transcript_53622/m.160067 type:complete len:201 (+) Transcript_53622:88-690(+)
MRKTSHRPQHPTCEFKATFLLGELHRTSSSPVRRGFAPIDARAQSRTTGKLLPISSWMRSKMAFAKQRLHEGSSVHVAVSTSRASQGLHGRPAGKRSSGLSQSRSDAAVEDVAFRSMSSPLAASVPLSNHGERSDGSNLHDLSSSKSQALQLRVRLLNPLSRIVGFPAYSSSTESSQPLAALVSRSNWSLSPYIPSRTSA